MKKAIYKPAGGMKTALPIGIGSFIIDYFGYVARQLAAAAEKDYLTGLPKHPDIGGSLRSHRTMPRSRHQPHQGLREKTRRAERLARRNTGGAA